MERFWIWFNILKISIAKKREMLGVYKIQDIFYKKDEIIQRFNLANNDILELYNMNYPSIATKVMEYNKKNDIGIIHILDSNYPELLKQIYDPPIVLYYKGNIEVLKNRFVSMFIGQDIDMYGRKVLRMITDGIYKDGIYIVTKFEEYNKNIFIRNASKENVLVVSSGIKHKFFTEKGIILSEYEPYIKSSKKNIIARNRIITGLTMESILIQTTIKDGAGYIVDKILQNNRELWVVPADITQPVNFYTNELIKHGANVLTQHNNLWVYEHDFFQKNMLTANNCHLIVTKE